MCAQRGKSGKSGKSGKKAKGSGKKAKARRKKGSKQKATTRESWAAGEAQPPHKCDHLPFCTVCGGEMSDWLSYVNEGLRTAPGQKYKAVSVECW